MSLSSSVSSSFISLFFLFVSCEIKQPTQNNEVTYPIAKKISKKLSNFGQTRMDDYFWLRERDNPEVIAYLNAENSYAEERLQDVADLRIKLFEEIKGRMAQTDISVPYNYNGYSYYSRFEEGKEYPFVCRKKIGSKGEEIMLDVNKLAQAFAYFGLGSQEISPNNRILAFGQDTLGRRIYTLLFKDLETGKMMPDKLEGTTGSAAFAKDNRTVFYTVQDSNTLRSHQIYRHLLGSPQSQDVLIFEERDETFYSDVYLSKSGEYIIVRSLSSLTTEYRTLSSNSPLEEFKVVQPRTRGLEYHIAHYGDDFFILNNADGASNFKLSKTPIGQTTKENWTEVIPERAETLLENIEIFKNYLVLEERNKGLTKLRVIPWKNPKQDHYISFNDPAYTSYISINKSFDTDLLRYGYSSLTTPASILDYDMATHQSELMKQQEVVGGFEPSDYVSERIFVQARDGAEIPLAIVYRKGYVRDGSSPLLLYGYGSYGSNMDAYFSISRISLLDRGFAFAIANIRGGQEMGRSWYEDGKLLNKKNTFTDFIDCAEYLITQQYTSNEHLYAMGGSAGGLLMGAVLNMRPDLWNGVVAQVPFVDVINTMLDASIPLTTGEYDEWGNPNERASYDYMMSYSPYDNIDSIDYPSLLVTTGLHDSQVQYWEPAKWVAKLRAFKTDTNEIFLVTNMDAGHGGASGRFEPIKERALEFAFLLRREGITK